MDRHFSTCRSHQFFHNQECILGKVKGLDWEGFAFFFLPLKQQTFDVKMDTIENGDGEKSSSL